MEISFVQVNARQHTKDADDGRLQTLASAIHRRLPSAPDAITVNEMNPHQLPKLVAFLNDGYRGSAAYAPVEPSGKGRAKAIVNTATFQVAAVAEWGDMCEPKATFQLSTLQQVGGQGRFNVAAVHLSPHYENPGECRRSNIEELRRQLGGVAGPAIIAGDFNKRAMNTERECDLEEASKMLPWWELVTGRSSDGPSFVDSVRHFNRSSNLSMKDQWTIEQTREGELCDGTTGYKRSRIDYVFVSDDVKILAASADTPGWADEASPGKPSGDRYSDHRFVAVRLAIG
jgi:endonuclease/exonuclease/phosphatase (EEP) superfamily protein YafD